jgi:protein-L-isoaspartate(D-aspartate) O-methyltransferase
VAKALRLVDRSAFIGLPEKTLEPERIAHVSDIEKFTPATESEYQQYLPLDHPFDHALQLDLLKPWLKPGASVLDCGSGSGYLSAVFALLVAADPARPGSVVSLERQMTFSEASTAILAKTLNQISERDSSVDKSILERMMVCPVDATSPNFFPNAPYDVIRVGFSIPSLECDQSSNLLQQLKRGGRMIAHVHGQDCLSIVDKDKNSGALKTSVASTPSKFPPPLFQSKVALENQDSDAIKAREERCDQVFAQLQSWRKNFQSSHGRAPTRVDMMEDPHANQLFVEFSKLNNLSE